MKWVIWNKTLDKFWDDNNKNWSTRYYATKFTLVELESKKFDFFGVEDLIIGVIAINV